MRPQHPVLREPISVWTPFDIDPACAEIIRERTGEVADFSDTLQGLGEIVLRNNSFTVVHYPQGHEKTVTGEPAPLEDFVTGMVSTATCFTRLVRERGIDNISPQDSCCGVRTNEKLEDMRDFRMPNGTVKFRGARTMGFVRIERTDNGTELQTNMGCFYPSGKRVYITHV